MRLSNKIVLITGGAGFIGSNLADKLVQKGYKVVVVDDLSAGRKENLNSKAEFYKIDICEQEISKIFKKEKPEIVFHFAAQVDPKKSFKDPIEDARTNILGSLNIFQNCKKFKVKKIIFASSAAVYGKANIFPVPEDHLTAPFSPYGIDKLVAEKYLSYYYNVYSLPFVSLRFANVYGPRQNSKGEAGVVAIFCDKILSKKQPTINGNGEQTRDFVYVDDAVKAALSAMESNKAGIYNIGTGKETDINAIFEMIKQESKSKCQRIYRPEEKDKQQRSCLDYSKAREELNWRPEYNLKNGLSKTIQWFKSKA